MGKRASQRKNEIMRLLMEHGSVSSRELARQFQVSTETIRKDMLFLQEEGLIQRTYGKAHIDNSMADTPVDLRTHQKSEEKAVVAQQALALIENDMVVFLDGGSTTLELAHLLCAREGVLVLTCSLSVANTVLRQKNTVYLTSGFISPATHTLNGPCAIASLKHFRPAAAFMGTNGICYHDGPTTTNFDDVALKQAIIHNCARTCVLCDSSKFSEGAVTQYAAWDEIDELITDQPLPQELHEKVGGHAHIRYPVRANIPVKDRTELMY